MYETQLDSEGNDIRNSKFNCSNNENDIDLLSEYFIRNNRLKDDIYARIHIINQCNKIYTNRIKYSLTVKDIVNIFILMIRKKQKK